MSAPIPYMPLHIGEYLADAAHLSTIEHGAYLLLIMNYWQRGEGLPADDRKLARIARMSDVEWQDARPSLVEFFTEADGRWTHKRIEHELAVARDKIEKKRSAGKASASSRSTDAQQPLNDKIREDENKGDETSSSPPRKRGGVKPSRIAEDWKPAKPYPDDVRSIVDKWPDGLIERRLREFVDYWLSRGRDATKADWDRTWWNRIRDIDEHLAQKRGAEPPVEQPVDSLNFDKAAEPTPIADFRRRLALAVGAKTYKQWHDPLILAFAEGRLSVLALTSVAGDHVRNSHGAHFDRIARQVFGPDTQVAWTASKRKAAA